MVMAENCIANRALCEGVCCELGVAAGSAAALKARILGGKAHTGGRRPCSVASISASHAHWQEGATSGCAMLLWIDNPNPAGR